MAADAMGLIRLATRKSPLALIQANRVADLLREASPGLEVELLALESGGDKDLTTAISHMGGVGIFAKEIQLAVLEGRADVAVHSAKDLPTDPIEGLVLAAVPERLDPRDALVGATLEELALGARVATGAPRRKALLHALRPDLEFVELRGNMARRLDRVGEDGIACVVVAAAALERLGLSSRIDDYLDPELMVPQVGQGALALEARSDDQHSLALLAHLDQRAWSWALRTERAFLASLGSGCSIPAACYAIASETAISARGFLGELDGSRSFRAMVEGDDPEELGSRLAQQLLDQPGAREIEGLRP